MQILHAEQMRIKITPVAKSKQIIAVFLVWKIIMGNPPTNVPMKTEEKNNIGSNNKNYYTREQKLEKRRRLTVGLTTERNCWHVLVTLLMNAAKHGESM